MRFDWKYKGRYKDNSIIHECRLFEGNRLLDVIRCLEYSTLDTDEYIAFAMLDPNGSLIVHVYNTGKIIFADKGCAYLNCDCSLENVKRWCEEYIASIYIKGYQYMVKSINVAKERADWFINNGYKGR